jgi:ketosteroid isomerase-like protein
VARARQDLDDEVYAFIKRGYELWNEGDLSTVAEMWSDDFELHTAPEWPGQSVFYGREAAIRFLTEEIAEVIAFDKIEVERIELVGDELVICMTAHTKGAESNLDIGWVPIFHVAQMRGGKVVRVRAFLDEDQAMAAARQGSTAG